MSKNVYKNTSESLPYTHSAVLKPACNNYDSVSNAIHHHHPLQKRKNKLSPAI